jgi:hypothetical protein
MNASMFDWQRKQFATVVSTRLCDSCGIGVVLFACSTRDPPLVMC